jgi:uncharacterized protein (TIGR02001 family)
VPWLGRSWLGVPFLVLLLQAIPQTARAQLSFNASLLSDYQLRGVSLSNGEPVATFGAAYDHSSGAYAGVTGVVGTTDGSGVQALGYVAYLGYARRLSNGVSWDVGVTNTRNSVYLPYWTYTSTYTEVYAGFSKGDISGRIYFSPKYLGQDSSTVYAELNDAVRPAKHWRIFGHVGALVALDRTFAYSSSRTRVDLRAGVARELGPCELHVAWTFVTPRAYYPEVQSQHHSAVVAGLDVNF